MNHHERPAISKFAISMAIALMSLGIPAFAIEQVGCDLNLSKANDDSNYEPNRHLKSEIESKLKDKLPEEFSHCSNKTEVWYEFLRGLAKIESDGKCSAKGDTTGAIGARGGSNGLFQMTSGDDCGNGKKLGNPNDAKENISCAVGIWAKPDFNKIINNKYWGPCQEKNPAHSRCLHIINTVKDQVCNHSGVVLDWHRIFSTQGGSNAGYGGGQR